MIHQFSGVKNIPKIFVICDVEGLKASNCNSSKRFAITNSGIKANTIGLFFEKLPTNFNIFSLYLINVTKPSKENSSPSMVSYSISHG